MKTPRGFPYLNQFLNNKFESLPFPSTLVIIQVIPKTLKSKSFCLQRGLGERLENLDLHDKILIKYRQESVTNVGLGLGVGVIVGEALA